jgi:NAD(P)-dependent dehydrogenase (short-subunit alcohol dehydrogenase family)
MVNLTRSMAIRYGPEGIRVNCVAPGGIATEMIAPRVDIAKARLGEDEEDGVRRATPLGRIADPEEIAYPILWMASDEASFVTGAILMADGGATA